MEKKGIVIAPHVDLYQVEMEDYVNVAHHAQISNATIGKRSSIGRYSKIQFAEIGSYCSCSWDVTIGALEHPMHSVSTHAFSFRKQFGLCEKDIFLNHQKVIIGNDVWIGCGAIIKSGVIIGDGAIIGANSMVTHDVEPYEIVGGVPARHIKWRFDEKIRNLLLELKWWCLPDDILRQHIDLFDINNNICDNEEIIEKIRNLFNDIPTS